MPVMRGRGAVAFEFKMAVVGCQAQDHTVIFSHVKAIEAHGTTLHKGTIKDEALSDLCLQREGRPL